MAHKYEDKEHKIDLEEAEDELVTKGCGVCNGCCGFCAFTNRYRVFTIVSFAAIGLCIGVGLAYWEPTDSDTK
jgi:hypothetical protein